VTELDWHDTGDLQYPENRTAPEAPAELEPPAVPTDGNRIVFAGTIDTHTDQEVCAMMGADPSSVNAYPQYQVIVLGTPQAMPLQDGTNVSPLHGPAQPRDVHVPD